MQRCICLRFVEIRPLTGGGSVHNPAVDTSFASFSLNRNGDDIACPEAPSCRRFHVKFEQLMLNLGTLEPFFFQVTLFDLAVRFGAVRSLSLIRSYSSLRNGLFHPFCSFRFERE